MSTFRGTDGYVCLGGILVGAPQLKGELLESETEMDIDGGGSALTGLVAVGDTFTITGESGTPTHTVTGGPFYKASGNEILGITFTPGIAAGGAPDDAAVNFTSNSMAQVTAWTLDSAMEVIPVNYKGLKHQESKGGIVSWNGTIAAVFDYGDPAQKELIDKIATGTPDGTIAALVLGTETKKQFYGGALLSGFSLGSPEGPALVPVSFNFAGDGAFLSDWN